MRLEVQRCESPIDLEAHHKIGVADGGAPYDPQNGTSLCFDCHQDVHGRDPQRAAWRRWVRQAGITS